MLELEAASKIAGTLLGGDPSADGALDKKSKSKISLAPITSASKSNSKQSLAAKPTVKKSLGNLKSTAAVAPEGTGAGTVGVGLLDVAGRTHSKKSKNNLDATSTMAIKSAAGSNVSVNTASKGKQSLQAGSKSAKPSRPATANGKLGSSQSKLDDPPASGTATPAKAQKLGLGGQMAAAFNSLTKKPGKKLNPLDNGSTDGSAVSLSKNPLVPAIGAQRKFNLQDFEIGNMIGKGAFACVHLVKLRRALTPSPDGKSAAIPTVLAMKSLRKPQIISTKQSKHVMNEKNLLQSFRSANNPFIVNMLSTFQDPRHLYMIMEYVPGGDLWSHIRRYGRFLEDEAKFYAAEIVLGMEFIHSKEVIYRDLKPENILVTKGGHLKITDFGFAKPHPPFGPPASTFCGTPAYMAPEIILKQPYTPAVDWWAVGIVTYELMAGYTPFYDQSPVLIYDKVIDTVTPMRWSSQIQGVARDFVGKLLERDVRSRMGTVSRERGGGLKGGGADVKAHPWFNDLNWADMSQCLIPPPFVPELKGDDDVGYFDIYKEQSSVVMMQKGQMVPESQDGKFDDLFKDF